MTFLLTISMAENAKVHDQPTPHRERIKDLDIQYQVIGRAFNNKKIINAIVNANFI